MSDRQGITFPEKPIIEVCFSGADPFISGVYGKLPLWVLDLVEGDFCENCADMLTGGDGIYQFELTYSPAQVGDEGRIEIHEYWEPEQIRFEPFQETPGQP